MDTQWKNLWDSARTAAISVEVVDTALRIGGRTELLQFLGELYKEFIGPDDAGGGEVGTLDAMRRVHDFLQPANEELALAGINPRHLSAYLHHDESATAQALQQAVA